ncbi:MAG: D-alanyl-D-alanine carboxypeptidase family protein [Lachnospiraceae bacterium]|nr:D-alanyl-D-alanine carboxypeptidase family protein [Lachnospiraceae bacterium]
MISGLLPGTALSQTERSARPAVQAIWQSPQAVLSSQLLTAYAAPSWPQSAGISADGGILMDADSGAILFEKNADQAYYPASITKILTALVVIEHCDLDEMVTFSHNAVYNVESGSSNMGALDGDILSVRDCLYGLMLASANESANALAEHCAGSIEAFAQMMNEKAKELGCTGSHFANPSGLNNENHYVTARDMALIMQAALDNPVFMEIDSALYWKHGPIQRYPDPEDPHNTVYAHHSMLKKNDSRYYPGAFAGKTGYTSLAGNTLVTAARRDGMTLICVILNGHQTHYQDTKTLFDYGFSGFQTIDLSDYDHTYTSIENDMTIAGLTASPISTLSMEEGCTLTLPQNADFKEVETTLDYELDASAPEQAVAEISYTYAGHPVGSSFLMIKDSFHSRARTSAAAAGLSDTPSVGIPEPTTKAMDETRPLKEEPAADAALSAADEGVSTGETLAESGSPASDLPALPGFSIQIPASVWKALAFTLLLAVLITVTVLCQIRRRKREEENRRLRKERRRQRLDDIGLSQEDFDSMIEQKRLTSRRRK